MRRRAMESGLTSQAIAGTHTVLLGIDLDDPAGCLGFGIHRTDHTEDEAYWLRGMKSFESVVPNPVAGENYSLRDQPLQGFQWGDYTAKPEHDYTYRVVLPPFVFELVGARGVGSSRLVPQPLWRDPGPTAARTASVKSPVRLRPGEVSHAMANPHEAGVDRSNDPCY